MPNLGKAKFHPAGARLTGVPLLACAGVIPSTLEFIMLTRKTPDTLATTLTINGQGEEPVQFGVVYHNRKQDDIDNVLREAMASEEAKLDMQHANRCTLLYVVKSADMEYTLDHAGLKDMESDRPGMIEAMFIGYHKARRVELAKN